MFSLSEAVNQTDDFSFLCDPALAAASSGDETLFIKCCEDWVSTSCFRLELDEDDMWLMKTHEKLCNMDNDEYEGEEDCKDFSASDDSADEDQDTTQEKPTKLPLDILSLWQEQEKQPKVMQADDSRIDSSLHAPTSDYCLKEAVIQRNISMIEGLTCQSKVMKCGFWSKCCMDTTFSDYLHFRDSFWGRPIDAAPSRTTRNNKIKELLERSYRANESKFVFSLKSGRLICEKAALQLLGLQGAQDKPCRAWISQRDWILSGKPTIKLDDAEEKKLKRDNDKRGKFRHALLYIQYINRIFKDTCPTDGSFTVVPIDTAIEFFRDYEAYCDANSISPMAKAGYSTFKKALKSVEKEIRLLGCKGSFQTCDICNCANDLLRNKGILLNKEQREVIMKFKRLHLQHQAAERKHNDEMQMLAKTEKVEGQPQYAWLCADGMTQHTSATPRVGKLKRKNKDPTFGNRIIGVEYVCGDHQGVFLYHIDDLQSGGANTMVEVMRNAFGDLSAVLKKDGLNMPRNIILLFDNCGENKNQYMFSYLSLLVQERIFEQIEVNFLIVGHTHTSIDQYFGTLTTLIHSLQYIGSPPALWAALSYVSKASAEHNKGHRAPCASPTVNRKIEIVYDYVSFLKPYMNNKIMYYGIPHNFRFRRIDRNIDICIMEYRLFSTFSQWLPKAPNAVMSTVASVSEYLVNSCRLSRYIAFGGEEEIFAALSSNNRFGSSTAFSAVINDVDKFKLAKVIADMSPLLQQIEVDAIDAQDQRLAQETFQCAEDCMQRYPRREGSIRAIEEAMRSKHGNEADGYLCWLRAGNDFSNLQPNMRCSIEAIETAIADLKLKSNISHISDSDSEAPAQDRTTFPDLRKKKTKINTGIDKAILGAKAVSSVARKFCENITLGKLPVKKGNSFEFILWDSNDNMNPSLEYVYTMKMATEYERKYFKDRDSVIKVLSLYRDVLASAPAFEWAPLAALSPDELFLKRQEDDRRRIEVDRTIAICAQALIPKKHDREDGDVILNGTLQLPRVTFKKAAKTDFCVVLECEGIARTLCSIDVCSNLLHSKYRKAYCVLHGPDHSAHENQMLKNEESCKSICSKAREETNTAKKRKILPVTAAIMLPQVQDVLVQNAPVAGDYIVEIGNLNILNGVDDIEHPCIAANSPVPDVDSSGIINIPDIPVEMENIATLKTNIGNLNILNGVDDIEHPCIAANSPAPDVDSSGIINIPDIPVEMENIVALKTNIGAIYSVGDLMEASKPDYDSIASNNSKEQHSDDKVAQQLRRIIDNIITSNSIRDKKVAFIDGLDYSLYKSDLLGILTMYNLDTSNATVQLQRFRDDPKCLSKSKYRAQFLSVVFDLLISSNNA